MQASSARTLGRIAGSLRGWLEHPLTRGLAIDDPKTTALRTRIVREKRFLRSIYEEWYRALAAAVPAGDEPVLEIGSGAGFLQEMQLLPGLVTSDVFAVPGVDLVVDGRSLPFEAGLLRGLVMTDALHHIPNVRSFLTEAARCVKPGGVMSMVEPWSTPWSRLIYQNVHHEPFRPDAAHWEFPDSGPLSGANGALPWILFERDRGRFEREFPAWQLKHVQLMMPFRYLVSGGVSMRTLSPDWSYTAWRALEQALAPALPWLAMFAHITLRRTHT